MRTPLMWIAAFFGAAFFVLAVYYWTTPAGSLPPYLPGYLASSAHIHFKHGLASLILALGLLVIAWFSSAPARPEDSERMP